MASTLLDYQTRHSRVYSTASDYITYLKFWCHIPAYKLKDDTPIETLPSNPSVDALATWMNLMGMDATPLYTKNIGEEKKEIDLSLFPGNPEWSHFLDRKETTIRESQGLFGPIWEPLEGPNSFQRTAIPIARMVELTCNETPWYLEDDYDVAPILYRIDNYLEAVQPRIEEQDIREYVDKLLLFREKFYDDIFLKVLNKRPGLKKLYTQAYYTKYNPLSLPEIDQSLPSPFVALRRPPITLPVQAVEEDFYHEKQSFEAGYI